MNAGLGVAAAIASAASFAAAGVLQQRAAARTSDQPALSVGLVASLARQRMWLTGVGLAAASYGLQALALSAQPLAVVQPLLVTEVVIAIPISARLSGHRLGGREWAGLLTIAIGLAATVWGAAPRSGDGGGTGSPLRWTVIGGGLLTVAVLLALAARGRSALGRARLYAAAAALVLSLSAAFMAATVSGFATDGLGGLAHPAPYGMAVCELVGMLFIQSAFQAGPLAVAMPILNWVQPLVAVLLGLGVLGESIATDPVHLAMLGLGALGALAGILVLDTSPRVRAMHQPAQPAAQPEASMAQDRPCAPAAVLPFPALPAAVVPAPRPPLDLEDLPPLCLGALPPLDLDGRVPAGPPVRRQELAVLAG